MNEDQLTLDTNDLIKGAKAPILPPAPEKQSPNDFIGRFVDVPKTANDYITKVDTEEARKRDDILNRLLDTGQQNTGQVYQDTFNSQARQLTGQSGDNLIQQLRDENTKLATLQGQFRTQAQKVSGAQGQSHVFEAPQLNELERERAVQVGNQALLVQALQGNYNTARQIALDTANFATQDRKAELDRLITQYNAVQDIVSGQEAQVIAGKKAEAEAEKAELERTQKAVDGAIMSGVATPQEMQQLVSSQLDGAAKQALAQQIMARAAGEDRTMAVEDRALERANIRDQMNTRAAGLALDRQKFNLQQRMSLLELAEKGDQKAIDELGYDPNNTADKRSQKQAAQDSAFKELNKINSLVGNRIGIGSSSGTIQSPVLARMLGLGATGAVAGAAAGSVVPGLGNLAGGTLGAVAGVVTGAATGFSAKREKENFLGQIDFLLSGDSFDKFRELKASGVTFGQTTEKEWDAVRKAANELESFAKRDGDGKLTGFKGSEEQLKIMLDEYQLKTQKFAESFIDENNASEFLDSQTDAEIDAIYGTSTPSFNAASYF